MPHHVVVLALDNVVAFELGLPARFFATDSLLPGWPEAPQGSPPYVVSHVTVDDGPVTTSAGYQVLPTHPVATLAEADTVVICGMPGHSVMRDGTLSDAEHAALDLVPDRARWISVCTGAFVLAARGMLDGLRVTTHWRHTEAFRHLFPDIDLDPDVLFVDNGSILTSAGNAAGIDLLLHVIRKDHGAAAAAKVARGCVVAPARPGGQAQFIDRPVPTVAGEGTGQTRTWALEHLEEPLTLADLAKHARMSVRTFTRHFRAETGQSAGEWLAAARIVHSRHLLEESDLSIDQVAAACGFGTTAAFRAQFRSCVGISPSVHRRSYTADRVG
ncbi:GlxA family transcriptional regulator [Flexivirga meconopsidis]|uniref:GlxA family transcriptional regulator n=1 Tax=Flexivirga meconopsidis TaxID=2977121 RepID=UPI0022402670|nr:helix-turn-helix domain-containing protein [Flexivirga meconopsidis]